MYYRPKLSSGEVVHLQFPLQVCRFFNGICWPLEDKPSVLALALDRVYYMIGFLIFMGHNEAEVHYLFLSRKNIDELLTGIPTFFVLIEIFLRAFPLGLRKEKLKVLLIEFYAKFYIDKSKDPECFNHIQRKLRPIGIMVSSYLATLGLFVYLTTRKAIVEGVREPLYKMTFIFDHTPLHIFCPIIFVNFWVGLIVITTVVGDLAFISEMLLHINERFLYLEKDLEDSAQRLLKEADSVLIAKEFQHELSCIISRSLKLYEFIGKVQAEFSYRIFIWFSFSAGLLCAVAFKVYTNPIEGVVFLSWSCAKIVELTFIGEVGSTLFKTTNEISSMYYHSKWELIIERSSNTFENVQLMKLIVIAMETSHNPIYLTGLNFFNVSLSAIIAILQGAGSYFTFLISLR